MEIREQDKRGIIGFKKLGWNEHEIAVEFFHRKYPIEYAHMRKVIQICLEETKK